MTLHQSLADWSSWLWPFLANHLWQSTLLSIAAFGFAALLKNAPGRARYAVWLIASAKFLVPSALLVSIANWFGLNFNFLFASDPDTANGFTVISQLTAPVIEFDQSVSRQTVTSSSHNEIFCLLSFVWLAGCTLLLGVWWSRRKRLRRAMQLATAGGAVREREALGRVRSWLGIRRNVALSVLPGAIEPGVWGVWKPVVLLPESMAEELTEAELEAVMMHELIHVQRGDNLAANLHRLLCCILWFHPVVWVLDRLLLREREQACDEEVIRLGGASAVYASSLLKVLRFCLGWNVAGASNATGSNLGRRVERIMSGNLQLKLSAGHRVAIAAVGVMAMTSSIMVGLLAREGVIAQTMLKRVGQSRIAGVPAMIGSAEIRMPRVGDSLAEPRILKWFKHVGDSIKVDDPLFEISAGGATSIVPSSIAGVLAQIQVRAGQTVPVDAVVAIIQPNGTARGDKKDQNQNTGYAISGGRDNLLERIEKEQAVAVDFRNSSKAPLTITDARAKSALRVIDQPGDEYAVLPMITVANNTDRRVKGFVLEFRNGIERRAYFEMVPSLVAPRGTHTSGAQRRLIFLTGGTSGWTVRVVGVLFEDGDVWGSVPPPPPPPPPPSEFTALDNSPEKEIRFTNREGSPLSITGVAMKSARIPPQPAGSDSSTHESYFIKLAVNLVNNTGRRITGVAIDYPTPDESVRMQTYSSVKIDPYQSSKVESPSPEHPGYGALFMRGNPDRMEARVMGVKFEDGGEWGSFPAEVPPPPPPAPPQIVGGPEADAPKLVRKSGGLMMGSATYRVDAQYPPLARAARITGSVVVEVTVDEAGAVIAARAISGHPLLKDAAVDAARQWQFAPTILSGVPTRVIGSLTFAFEATSVRLR